MAASGKTTLDGFDESSTSEDEDLEKLKEAVWNGGGTKKTDEGNNPPEPKPTRRLVVSDHQHDCNDLQVTPEFRAHVAKKLEHILDGFISEKAVSHESSSTLEEDDLGFKLFATSIPGQRVDDTPCPVKRRPVPSSSESDDEMEMRIREAAVSLKSLLPPPLTAGEVTMEKVDGKNPTEQSQEDGTESPAPKKKKKKRKMKATCEEQSLETVDSDHQKGQGTPTHKNVKKLNQVKMSAKCVSEKCLGSWEGCGEQQGSAQAKMRRKRKRKHKAVDKHTEV